MKKGSMELSVNSIVILVIAVVMMGLILGFIRSQFGKFQGEFLVDESKPLEATASEPITLSKNNIPVTGTKKTGLNINFYNTHTSNIDNAVPLFQCNNNVVVLQGEYYPKTATTSSMLEYTGNIRLKNSVPKNTYLCKVCFLKTYNAEPNNNPCSNSENAVAEKEFNLIVQ